MIQRKRMRHPKIDYTFGCFFVTLAVQNRNPVFGTVEDNKMSLFLSGVKLEQHLTEMLFRFPQIKQMEYVIMPDHLHLLVFLATDKVPEPKLSNLSGIIGALKSLYTRDIRKYGSPAFQWQRSFHERKLFTQEDIQKVRFYMENHPKVVK